MEIFLISGPIIKQHACLCRQEYQKKKKKLLELRKHSKGTE